MEKRVGVQVAKRAEDQWDLQFGCLSSGPLRELALKTLREVRAKRRLENYVPPRGSVE